jgi:hypothetical protein
MKKREMLWSAALTLLAFAPMAAGQIQPQTKKAPAQTQAAAPAKSATAPTATSDQQQKNIQEYITLLRTDVRKKKAQVMGGVMQLDSEQASIFWPIYKQYEQELDKVNDLRAANIQQYARDYGNMTDAEADDLVQKAMDFHKQRSDLLAKYYGNMKAALGAVLAARFVQVENQLLSLIDLELNAQLPLAQ